MEIERRFLITSPPSGWRALRGSPIRQGYFSLRGKGVEIRLREKGSHCFLTIKAGRGTIRLEEEIAISRERLAALWPLVRSASLTKTRYGIPFDGRTIELDVYHGPLRGLMTADVEFPSSRAAKSFQPPPWLGREITGNRRYTNESLARRQRV